MHNIDDTECGNITKNIVSLTKHYYELEYCTCMASLTEKQVILWGAEICDKYEVSLPKVDEIHMLYKCPKLLEYWKLYSNYCYTTAQNW